MEIQEARKMISSAFTNGKKPVVWADFGCGSGIFTQALADLLSAQSTVYAVDKSKQLISQAAKKNVKIEFIQSDFEKDDLHLPALDGILMANSLHYVSDKKRLLERQRKFFADEGKYIIVEYDMMNANAWVPYPIDFLYLKKLFGEIGYNSIEKLAERPSVYGRGNMYASFLQKRSDA